MTWDATHAGADGVQGRWMLFIEGLPYIWTTDRGDVFTENGVDQFTWLSGFGGGRSFRHGLHEPSPAMGIDERTGLMERRNLTLTLTDLDGTLATLFGTEPAPEDIDILAKTLPAGSTALVDGGIIVYTGGAGDPVASDPRGVHVGNEYIGSTALTETTGGRNERPVFPVSMPGPEHHVDTGAQEDAVLGEKETPDIPVTADPLTFEGRWVALYYVWHDRDGNDPTNVQQWGTWLSHFNAGGRSLRFWGRMLDRPTITGAREWGIRVAGPDSLFAKTLNYDSWDDWRPVAPTLSLSSANGEREDAIAISFYTAGGQGISETTIFQGTAFDTSTHTIPEKIGFELAASINAVISDVRDGTNTNMFTGNDALTTPSDGHFVSMDGDGTITLHTSSSLGRKLVMLLCLHRKVWTRLGFDVEAQQVAPGVHRVNFMKVQDATTPGYVWEGSSLEPPGHGYWLGEFSTIPVGGARGISEWDNDGATRRYRPLNDSGAASLQAGAEFEVQAPGGFTPLTPHLIEPTTSTVQTPTAENTDSVRLFAFRGIIRRREKDTDTILEDQVMQFAKVSWKKLNDGSVEPGESELPRFRLERWIPPQIYGAANGSIGELLPGEDTVWYSDAECVPLGVTAGFGDIGQHEPRATVILRLMLSSGTGGPWDTSGVNPMPALGENAHSSTKVPAGNDFFAAQMGLGIPAALIADPGEFADAFDETVGDYAADMHRVVHAFRGPFIASDVMQALTLVGGVGWRLHGGQYSLFAVHSSPSQSDVDIDITESDCRDTAPVSSTPFGRFSEFRLKFRGDIEGKHTGALRKFSFDRSARARPAKTPLEIEDLGMSNRELFTAGAPAYVPDWRLQAQTFWTRTVAEFWAKRNFVVTNLVILRSKAVQVMPGTLIRLTHQGVLNPVTGSYGVTNAICRVLGTEHDGKCNATCRLLVYGDSLNGVTFQPYYAPVALVTKYDSSTRTVYVESDFRTSRDPKVKDLNGFALPSWYPSGTGDMVVQFVEIDRAGTFPGAGTATVSSVDEDAGTMVLEAPGFTSHKRDKRYYVFPAAYASQGQWVKDLYGVITEPDGTHSSGTAGRPFRS